MKTLRIDKILPFNVRVGEGHSKKICNDPIYEILKQWISILLSTLHEINVPEGLIIHACTPQKRVKAAPVISKLRSLVCASWINESELLSAVSENPIIYDAEFRKMWLLLIYQTSFCSIKRWMGPANKEVSMAIAKHSLSITSTLDLQHVLLAIEAGWIGYGTRSTKPWLAEARLRQMMQTPLPKAPLESVFLPQTSL